MKKAKNAVKPKKSAPKSPTTNARNITDAYQASIKVFGKIYKASGETLSEAIAALKPEGLARGMSVLVVKKGDVSQEKILPRVATVRLFSPSVQMREVALKHTIARFSL